MVTLKNPKQTTIKQLEKDLRGSVAEVQEKLDINPRWYICPVQKKLSTIGKVLNGLTADGIWIPKHWESS